MVSENMYDMWQAYVEDDVQATPLFSLSDLILGRSTAYKGSLSSVGCLELRKVLLRVSDMCFESFKTVSPLDYESG